MARNLLSLGGDRSVFSRRAWVGPGAKASGIPELEAALRGGEEGAELGIAGGEFLAVLEDLVVEPAFALADVVRPLLVRERRTAVWAGHEAGTEHESGIGRRQPCRETLRACALVSSEAKS